MARNCDCRSGKGLKMSLNWGLGSNPIVLLAWPAPDRTALGMCRKAGPWTLWWAMKGDGKPVSFIEDCAVTAWKPCKKYTKQTHWGCFLLAEGPGMPTPVLGTLHVRPILDMRRDGAQKNACDRRRKRQRWFANTKVGVFPRRAWRWYLSRRGVAWQFGPQLNAHSRRLNSFSIPEICWTPACRYPAMVSRLTSV